MPEFNAPADRSPSKGEETISYSTKETGRYKAVEPKSIEPEISQDTSGSTNRYGPKPAQSLHAIVPATPSKNIEPTNPEVVKLSEAYSLKNEIKRLDGLVAEIEDKLKAPISVEAVMSDPNMQKMLRKQAEKEYSTENLDYLEAVARFDNNPSKEGFKDIYNNFIRDDTDSQINISSKMRNEFDEMMKIIDEIPDEDIGKGFLEDSRASVSRMVETETLMRLKIDPEFKKYADTKISNLKEEKIAVVAQSDTFKSQLWKNHADELKRGLQKPVDPLTELVVDFERLSPLGERAMKILEDSPSLDSELKTDWESLIKALKNPDTTLKNAQEQLVDIDSRVRLVILGENPEIRDQRQTDSLKGVTIQKDGNDPIGTGNFGEVYKLQGDNGIELVGKFAIPGKGAKFLEEVKHEAQVYAKVGEHPNIARCFGIHKVDGLDTLVLENVEGGKLETMFRNLENAFKLEKINWQEYVGALQQLIKGSLQGLAQFETMGMVHLDIKSDNIMFDSKTMQPKLVDMGLAQEVGSPENTDVFPPNMAPEFFLNNKELNKTTDSYGIGRMLYPLMEHDAINYQFRPGGVAEPADFKQGAFVEKSYLRDIDDLIKKAENASKKTQDGVSSWEAIRKLEEGEQWTPGTYGAKTSYVDFMNQLTHADPNIRLKPSEALKHPFMTDSFGEKDELVKVLTKMDYFKKVDERDSVDSNFDIIYNDDFEEKEQQASTYTKTDIEDKNNSKNEEQHVSTYTKTGI